MWKRLILVVAIVWAACSWWQQRPLVHAAGVIAPHAPLQEPLSSASAFEFKGYRITPLAQYDIEARLLAREHYRMGRETDLSTLDFGVGWGRMSDEAVVTEIKFSQSNRYMHWRVKDFPIPESEIETSAANMHLIPADALVDRQLERMRVGSVVRLHGLLVRADAPDGWHWISSLSRDDTGYGACELFWVQRASAR